MVQYDKKLWYKANRKPVGLGRAVELRENHPDAVVDIIKVGKADRHGFFKYNVYVRRVMSM